MDFEVLGSIDYTGDVQVKVFHGSTGVADQDVTAADGLLPSVPFTLAVTPGQSGTVLVKLQLRGKFDDGTNIVTDPEVFSEQVDYLAPAPSLPAVTFTPTVADV